MKKVGLLLMMVLLVMSFVSVANPVDLSTAQSIGAKFLSVNTRIQLRGANDLQLVKTYSTERGDAAFYIFNAPSGFVIVATDDCATPILGYSDEGQLDIDNIPIQMEEYLQGFVEQIEYGVNNNIEDETIARQWRNVSQTGNINNNGNRNAVEPLLTCLWDQGCNYNIMCPTDPSGPCGHVYAGCVATAMGQIMYYWGYPATGSGSHTYNPSGYPQQSINFWETEYDWDNMPDQLTSNSTNVQKEAVGTLLWHCGVAVDMMYGPGGSGTYSTLVPNALKNYFNYEEDLYGQNKGNNAEWLVKIKSNLDTGWPIYYSGASSTGGNGHAFVCDGYDANDYLHFNWGWSGSANGYFSLGAMNASGMSFSYYNYAVFNIHPHQGTETYTVTTETNPVDGGTTTGDGSYNYAQTCTLTATPNENYLFVNWTKNGYQVSTEPTCHVTVKEDATYVANFRRTNVNEVVVGVGTTVSSNLPLTASNSYSLSQQIYLANEINYSGPITDVSFYYSGSNNTENTLSLSVFLKHTQKTSFSSVSDWESLTTEDLCYTGSLIIDGQPGWKQISLDKEFIYNGTDNILVCVDNNTGTNISNFEWKTYQSNSRALTLYGNDLNYNPYSPLSGNLVNQNNHMKLMFQVTQTTDFVVTPDPVEFGTRPSGCWAKPLDVNIRNAGMTTFINNITTSSPYYQIDLNGLTFPLLCEYDNDFNIKINTGVGEGPQNATLVINFGDNQTKQVQLLSTAYIPAAADTWESATEVTSFPYTEELSSVFRPLYNNYTIPPTDIPDGPDAVYKIVLEEESYLSASVTSGENGKVALYNNSFKGVGGPDVDNSFNFAQDGEWMYYVDRGAMAFGIGNDNLDFYWGVMFPVEKLQPQISTWLTKVAIDESVTNYRETTLNIYLGGDNAPGEMVLTKDYIPKGEADLHELVLDEPIYIDGTQNLWITFHQVGDPYPAEYAPVSRDPNSKWCSNDGVTWGHPDGLIAFPIHGFFSYMKDGYEGIYVSNNSLDNMDLMPGTYYLVASSTSENWSIEINKETITGPEPPYNPIPTNGATGIDYDTIQFAWTLGAGTTEYKLMFGKSPYCEHTLVPWTDNLESSYTLISELDWNTTYYWKICERNSECPNGKVGPVWSFTTQSFVPKPREITVEVYPSGGSVTGTGVYVDGQTCTLTAIPNNGYVFKRWTESGLTITTNPSYSFQVKENKKLIAVFASTANINFAENKVKELCVASWDTNGDGELSYSEAADVTSLGYQLNSWEYTTFNELQYFTNLRTLNAGNFNSCFNLKSLVIPRFVDVIELYVFFQAKEIISISVVEENETFDSRDNCKAIIRTKTNQLTHGCKKTVIPNSVVSIGELAFVNCQLSFITLPNSIRSIEKNAFSNCSWLSSITLPDSLLYIGECAFGSCSGLTSIHIPDMVTTIEPGAFGGCKKITEVTVSPGNVRYDSRNNCNAIVETRTNKLIAAFKTSIIPSSICSFGDYAFSACGERTEPIRIPRSVNYIGERAFQSCNLVDEIDVISDVPPVLGNNAFYNLDKTGISVYVPCDRISVYQCANGWNDFPNYYERSPYNLMVYSSQSTMGSVNIIKNADCNNDTVEVMAIPNFDCIFVNWTQNGEIVSTNADYSFVITSDVDLVANFAPIENWDLPIIFADSLVKEICVANWDTNGDGELNRYEANAVTSIESVFQGNTQITSFNELQYFTGLTTLPTYSFINCKRMTSIIIPNTVTSIGSSAFSFCAKLQTIVLPKSLSYIGDNAFNNCLFISSITILSETPPIIHNNAFTNINKSIPVYIPCGSTSAYTEADVWNEFYNFKETSYDINVGSVNPMYGVAEVIKKPDCSDFTAVVKANPYPGCEFLNWTIQGEVVSTDDEYEFIIDSDRYLEAHFSVIGNGYIPIVFADSIVKSICVTYWDTNGDGELSYNEAFAVEDIGQVFYSNQDIVYFDELQYFFGLTTIPYQAFYNCKKLKSIIIPHNVTTIDHYAFYNCYDMQHVALSDKLETMGFGTFGACFELPSIHIPKFVSSIGSNSFRNCKALLTIIVDPNNVIYDSRNNCNAIIETANNTLVFGCKGTVIPNTVITIKENAFAYCSTLNNIVVPSSVLTIESHAFLECTSMENIVIGSSISSIVGDVFQSCYSLQSIKITAPTPPTVANGTFNNVSTEITVYVPCGKTSEYMNASGWNTFSNYSESFPYLFTATSAQPIYGSAVICKYPSCSDDFAKVYATPFSGCRFDCWTNYGDTVSMDAEYSFNIYSDQQLVAHFTLLEDWDIPIVFEDSLVKSICVDNWDLNGDGELSRNEAAAVKNIGEIFKGTRNIINFNEFQYFTGLTAVSIRAFENCYDLTSIIIPKSVKSIEARAFHNCSALSSITIPNSVTHINTWAFNSCWALSSIIVYASIPPTIVNNTFHVYAVPVYVPCGTSALYQNAAYWNSFSNINEIIPYELNVISSDIEKGTVSIIQEPSCDTDAIIQASPNKGYVFTHWTKNATFVSTEMTYTFTLNENTNLVAHFLQEGEMLEVTSTSNPTDGGTITGVGNYNFGETCTLTATANYGYTFQNWTKDGVVVSTEPNYSFTVTESASFVANFTINTYEITISANIPEGGILTGAGNYNFGETCTLTATANYGYTFQNWTKDGVVVSTEPNYSFTVTESASFVANFTINTYEITLSANIPEGGDLTGAGNYNFGETCTLTATANYGYTFQNWTKDGVVVSTEPTYSFIVTEEGNYIVNFQLNSYEITVMADPEEGGIVYGDDMYDYGSTCTLTATANAGYTFTNWTMNGVVVSYDANYSFTVTEDATYIANFELVTYTITVIANPVEGGTIIGEGTYTIGSTCTLTVLSNDGYAFAQWREFGEIVSTDNIYSFQVMEDRILTADFTLTGDLPGSLDGVFSTSNFTHVHFSKGNLQYIGNAITPYWRFADNQWDYIGKSTSQSSNNTNCNRDLFSWGTSGYNHGAIAYQPWQVGKANNQYYAYGNLSYNLNDQTGQADWGYNAIKNGGNVENCGWRTLTNDEWVYILYTRSASTINGIDNARYAKARVNNVCGVIIFPDNYTHPDGITQPENINTSNGDYFINVYNNEDWVAMEDSGCVFLPTAGYIQQHEVNVYSFTGMYWSSICKNEENAYLLNIGQSSVSPNSWCDRNIGCSVRLVQTIPTYYTIEAVPNPNEGGTIIGADTYLAGDMCTLVATPSIGYTFQNWTKDGEIVSTEAEYSFTVTESAEYVANFDIQSFVVTASSNPSDGGDVIGMGTYNYGTTCTLTATPNEGYSFMSWSCDGVYVSSNTTYSFTVTENRNIVANFMEGNAVTQSSALSSGWNWYSTYIELSDIDGLAMLEEQLGENAESINSQTSFTMYYGNYGWYGSLTSINNESMYRIKMSSPTTINMMGMPVNPADHPITVTKGWNHIGYLSSEPMAVDDALAGMESEPGDIVKNQSTYAQYYDGYGWYGSLSLSAISPGQGLMYKSVANESKTFTYPTNPIRSSLANYALYDLHWMGNPQAYPANMTMMAVVELGGEEVKSEDYELAVFAKGECRGSVRLQYVEPIDRYVAFLTISGDEDDYLYFGLYNRTSGSVNLTSENRIVYHADDMIGGFEIPYVVRFSDAEGGDIKVYPNPVKAGESLNIVVNESATVEIINALGEVVAVEKLTRNSALRTPATAGVYMLRIITADNNVTLRRVVIE